MTHCTKHTIYSVADEVHIGFLGCMKTDYTPNVLKIPIHAY